MLHRPRTTRPSRSRPSLVGVVLLAALGTACSFGGSGFEQVPPSVRDAVARSEAHGGPYADPPLERYPKAFVDSGEVVERLESVEDELRAAASERASVRDSTVAVDSAARDRDASLEEIVRVESDVARAGRERIATDVAQLEVRTEATEEGVEELDAEIATSLEQETARDARLSGIETSLRDLDTELDERLTALEEPKTDPELESRLDSIELALADLRTTREDAARAEDVDALRTDLATLRDGLARAADPDAPSTSPMLSAGSNGYLAFSWGDTALLVIVLVVIVLLVLNVLRMRAERERDRHALRLFGRIEDAVRALDEHVSRQAARDDDRRRNEAVPPVRTVSETTSDDEEALLVDEDDARSSDTAADTGTAPTTEAGVQEGTNDAATSGGRWERFVERVESPTAEEAPVRITPRPATQHAPGTRRRRVLDRSFLERYRGRGTDSSSRA